VVGVEMAGACSMQAFYSIDRDPSLLRKGKAPLGAVYNSW